jgi:hypothetical protein
MKTIKFGILAVVFLTVQSWAIFGIGGHWSPSLGTLDGSNDSLDMPAALDTNGFAMTFDQEGINSMQGFGFKFWVDVIPFIDIEGTFNTHFGRYNSTFIISNPDPDNLGETTSREIPVKIDFELPFFSGEATPVFVSMVGDVSVTYPFLKLDLPLMYFQLHGGGGVSYFFSTPAMNADFAQKFLENGGAEILADPSRLQSEEGAIQLGKDLAKSLVDEGLNTGVGGHVVAGARFKLAIIGVYTNVKYYFGGDADPQFSNGIAFELGGGLAF